MNQLIDLLSAPASPAVVASIAGLCFGLGLAALFAVVTRSGLRRATEPVRLRRRSRR
jgi:hypothetical protein